MDPPAWLDSLGTQLNAKTHTLLQRIQAAQPSPQRPLRCGLRLQPHRLTIPTCAAEGPLNPECVALTLSISCRNL